MGEPASLVEGLIHHRSPVKNDQKCVSAPPRRCSIPCQEPASLSFQADKVMVKSVEMFVK